MKKFDLKSLIVGVFIGTIGLSTVFAASNIKSATYSPSRVYLNGKEIPLKNSLVSIVKYGETNAQTYMPMRELLEFMNYVVEWNPKDSSINLSLNDKNGGIKTESPELVALNLVKNYIAGSDNSVFEPLDSVSLTYKFKDSNYMIQYDGKLDDQYHLIHEYEFVVDNPKTGAGHTATSNWYQVDIDTGEIIPMF